MTGNRNKDLCKFIVEKLEADGHECICVSRENGFDFNEDGTVNRVVREVEDCDIFINLYANFFFQSILLAHNLWHKWNDDKQSNKRLINIGSTTENVRRAKTNRYHYEKLALQEWSNGVAQAGVWNSDSPKVTHISIGTMDNRAEDNPGRTTLNMEQVADYIKWVIDQPSHININKLSIDPIQN